MRRARKPAPRRGRNAEHDIQCAVVQWATLHERDEPRLELLFAIPSGGARSVITGARLKAEGTKRGLPDLCLPAPNTAGYLGLWIELKAPGGRVSPEQQWWIDRLNVQGYHAVVCTGWIEAVRTIADYLGMESGI